MTTFKTKFRQNAQLLKTPVSVLVSEFWLSLGIGLVSKFFKKSRSRSRRLRSRLHHWCYWQVLPEQRVLVYKISFTEKPINRTKTTVTTRSVNQWKLVVNPLPGQQRLADYYPRTITPIHLNKIAVKCQQKSHEYYLMDNHDQEVHVTKSSYDRKCMWQEMRQRSTNWSSEEENPNINKPKKVPEANQVDQSQEAIRRSNQSKHLK